MPKHCCNLNDAIVCNACSALRRRIKKEWRAKYESPKSAPIPMNPYPKVCTMVGVHPSQVEEANAHLERCGVAPNIMPSGDLYAPNRKYMSRYAKAMGQVFKNE